MSELSGSLEDFPLPDVLRLLAKGHKDGVLHMYGDVVRGRVYLDDGRISYATTRETDDFAEGQGSEPRKSEDRRRVRLDEVHDDDPELFGEVLRLQIVEVLVRLGRETSGSFVFQNGVAPQEPVKEPFEVNELLAAAEAELKEWHRIESIIGTTSTPLRMVTGVPDDQKISLDGTAWNALAALGDGDTTRAVAERLNVFEIVAARIMARLVEDDLVEIARDPKAAVPTTSVVESYESDPPVREEPVLEPRYVEEVDVGEQPAADDDDDDDDEPDDHELSEEETREVFSALSGASSSSSADSDEPRSAASLGFEGLDDEPATPAAQQDQEEAPPASELARRWRNLRAGNAD